MSLTDAALELARAGWPVFPVDAKTKRPRTPHGHLDATANPDDVVRWEPLFKIGGAIATPTGNGRLVVDVDPRNGGRVPPWLPPTLSATTQSDGVHLHYAVDRDVPSRASILAPGVDIKCAGGYVLLPPSPGYAWFSQHRPTRIVADWLEAHYAPQARSYAGAARLAPKDWYRGVIHDQVVAWAAFYAAQLDDEREVATAVWRLVDEARAAGVGIDNARGHIDAAIRWVLQREASKT